jgi:hypothetical protein
MPLLVPGMPDFDAYATSWARWISSKSDNALTPKAPIRGMFATFREFYSQLAELVPEVTYVAGRHAFLHRARVAREQENVESFRTLRNELIAYWYAYLEREEVKKKAMEKRLGRMLDVDIYPSHEWDEGSRSSSRTVASSSTSPSTVLSKTATKKRLATTTLFNPTTSPPVQQRQNDPVTIDISDRSQTPAAYIDTADFDLSGPIDSVDVGCFAHVNLSSDWYSEPGPSTKKRRVDSGFSEMEERSPSTAREGEDEEVVYVGKGKGRMGEREVICID